MAAPNAQIGQGGRSPNRKRNTANNMITDRNLYTGIGAGGQAGGAPRLPSGLTGGDLPALDPSMVANYYGQVQTLQSQLAQNLAALRSQRVGMRGDARVARADAKASGVMGMSETVNNAMERGMLGSSGELSQRAGVRADTAGAIADVNRQLYQGIAESRIAGSQAQLAFQQGVQGIEAQAIASRMQLAQQEEQNRLAIQVARMQAAATDRQTDAQMKAARRELIVARQTAQGMETAANNPYAQYVGTPWYDALVRAGMAPPAPGTQMVNGIKRPTTTGVSSYGG